MTEGEFYKIDGNKVWLSPTALEYAREYFGAGRQGVQKMAKYLMMQQAALTPPTAPMSDLAPYLGAPRGPQQEYEATTEEQAPLPEFLPDAPPSENIEDRRDQPIYGAGALKNIWGNTADVPPVVRTYGPNPLANALGFGDVGRAPAPAPQVLGPYQPRPFIPEGY